MFNDIGLISVVVAKPVPSLARWASDHAPTALTSVVRAQLERVTAWPLRTPFARTVATGGLSVLIPRGALARPPKPTDAAAGSKARFGVYVS